MAIGKGCVMAMTQHEMVEKYEGHSLGAQKEMGMRR